MSTKNKEEGKLLPDGAEMLVVHTGVDVAVPNLLAALKMAEKDLTYFCNEPDEEGRVTAPDSVFRVRLNQIREVIKRAEMRIK